MHGWKRDFSALWAGQFLSLFAFNLVWPFLPLYLQEVGEVTPTEAAIWASVLVSTSSLAMAVTQPIWGVLADRYGRKLMVQRSMLSGAIILTLTGLAQSITQIWVLRVAQGALTGTMAANTALAAGIVPRARIGFALGLLHSALYLSNAISPIVGGFVAGATNLRVPFYLTGAFMLAGAALVTFFVRDPSKAQPPGAAGRGPGEASEAERGLRALRWVLAAPAILVTAGAYFALSFANLAAYPVISIIVQELTPDPGQVTQMVGLLIATASITGAIASASAGRLGDTIGHRRMLVIATLGAGALYVPHAFATSLEQLFVLRAILGIFLGGAVPSANAIVAQAAQANRQGSAFGVTSMFQSFGSFVGPLLGAVVTSQLGIRGVFLMTGAVMLLVTIWIAVMLRRVQTPGPAIAAAERGTPR